MASPNPNKRTLRAITIMNHFSIKFFCTIGSILSISLFPSLLKVWFRSEPEFSLHTHLKIKNKVILCVCGVEKPNTQISEFSLVATLRAFFLIQIFPHTQQAVLEHQHTCAQYVRTHTAKATHSHGCAFLGGYRSWRCLTACSACLHGLLRWTSEKLSHTCPLEIGMCEL